MKTKVAVYFRCSTDKQDRSIADQRRVLMEYAQSHDLTITAWYDKDEGISGTSFEKRPDFMRMVGDVESGRNDFSQILVYDVDRWGRPIDPDESVYWEYHFKRLGVQVTYSSDESINDNSLAGRLTKKIKQELATEESQKQSLRVRERSKMRAAEGFRVGGFAPYGFKRLLVMADRTPIRVLEHGERKYEKHHRVLLTPGDPREIKVVCQMFSMKAGGSSIRDVLEWLNSNRVPAPSRDRLTTSRNAPGRWGINAVYVILTNPVYCGDTVYNKQVRGNWARLDEPGLNRRNAEDLVMVTDSHEGIVSRDLFLTVQASLSQDKRPRKGRSWKESPYLLSGLIQCKNCGYKFHGHTHKRRNTLYHYYEDSGFNLHGKLVCQRSLIAKDGLEQFVLNAITDRILPGIDKTRLMKEIRQRLKQKSQPNIDSDRLRAELGENSRKLENIKDSI